MRCAEGVLTWKNSTVILWGVSIKRVQRLFLKKDRFCAILQRNDANRLAEWITNFVYHLYIKFLAAAVAKHFFDLRSPC